jgi:hypothetical protein
MNVLAAFVHDGSVTYEDTVLEPPLSERVDDLKGCGHCV